MLAVREERSATLVLNRFGRDMGQQVGGATRILDLVAAVGQLDDVPVIAVATKTFYEVGASSSLRFDSRKFPSLLRCFSASLVWSTIEW